MPEGDPIPPKPNRLVADRRERLLIKAAAHLRELADICEALCEAPGDDA